MANFRHYDQNQGIFRPIIVNELLEPEHPARIIDKIVEMLDLTEIYSYYSEEGNPAYHPKMMLKILFYAYYVGLMSCRKIWDGVKGRADFMFLSGGQVPDFRTINKFRTRHIDVMPKLFAQIVFFCVELDMVGFKNLAIDGQIIHANANYRKSKNKERLKKSFERVESGLKKLLEKEINEDFTEEKKKDRLEKLKRKEQKLQELKKALEETNSENANINMTDTNARVMAHKDGRKLPSYNHQSAVDDKLGVCVSIDTRDEIDKPDDLLKLVDCAKDNTGKEHKNVLADAGFVSYEILEKVTKNKNEEFYLPDKRFKVTEKNETKKGKYDLSNFVKNDAGDVICPEGHLMVRKSVKKYDAGYSLTKYQGMRCGICKHKEKCTKSENRIIYVDSREKYRKTMREKLKSDKGREIYMKRQGTVESVHGNDQKNKGWVQHYLRGIAKATLEFTLIRIAHNLGKIIKYKANKIVAIA